MEQSSGSTIPSDAHGYQSRKREKKQPSNELKRPSSEPRPKAQSIARSRLRTKNSGDSLRLFAAILFQILSHRSWNAPKSVRTSILTHPASSILAAVQPLSK